VYFCRVKNIRNNGKENEGSTPASHSGVHRAKSERSAGYVKIYYDKEQKKHSGQIGTEEVQSVFEENDYS
jgi:hypothetical protein